MVIFENKNYFKITEAAELLGVHPDTLRRWDELGRLTPIRTPGGTRIYKRSQLNKFIKRKKSKMRSFVKNLISLLLDIGADTLEQSFDLHHEGEKFKITVRVVRQ